MRYLISLWMLLMSYPILAQDLALAMPGGDIIQPVSGCSLSSSENVSVRIFNFGATLPAGTIFNASYSINGGAPVTEFVTLPSTLLSHSSFTYTFITTANLSASGNYTLDATVSLAGDINPTNNALTGRVVTNSVSSVGGTVNTDQTICGTTNSGMLTLIGHTGDILRWETSQDAGLTWRYVSQTTTQQNFLNLATTTQYRAVVQNGTCNEVTSTDATVTITCGLPLTWISFDARRAGNHVELQWQTANEVHTSHFIIERSVGNNSFEAIGTVPARSSTGKYQFTDRQAPAAALQYRAKQVDLDDAYTYSPVRRIAVVSVSPTLLLRNNPVKNGMLTFDVQGYPNGNAVVTIFNMSGRKIRTAGVWLNDGGQSIHIPIQGEAAGIYLLTIQAGNIYSQEKFVKIQ